MQDFKDRALGTTYSPEFFREMLPEDVDPQEAMEQIAEWLEHNYPVVAAVDVSPESDGRRWNTKRIGHTMTIIPKAHVSEDVAQRALEETGGLLTRWEKEELEAGR